MDKPLEMWIGFLALVGVLLLLDLGLFNRKEQEITVSKSLWMSGFYILIALMFGGYVWWELGAQSGKEYVTGYLIEKSLSLDNVFVISLIFSFFAIPASLQHRVLFWGILGVIVLRAIMIGLGAALVTQFSWVLYLFALFLIITGVKMLFLSDHGPDVENHFILRLMRRYLPITDRLHGHHFFVRLPDPQTGRKILWCTPLFVTLVFVEFVDLVFAVDSVPAIFALTKDPYIVYTSNIFAILGLRALYFALAAMIHRFVYLKYSLAVILIFIGSKIFVADVLGLEKFPAGISLGVTLALLAFGVVFSLYKTQVNAQGRSPDG